MNDREANLGCGLVMLIVLIILALSWRIGFRYALKVELDAIEDRVAQLESWMREKEDME